MNEKEMDSVEVEFESEKSIVLHLGLCINYRAGDGCPIAMQII